MPAAALTDVRAITAGHEYSVALKQDGTVVAWGANHAGQVTGTFSGNSAPRATASPVKLGGEALREVTAIAAGSSHTVAVRGDGSIVAWGRNDNGQVTGTPTGPYPAPAIANPVTLEGHVVKGVVAVAAGGAHTVALKNDGTVVAWGNNYAGQVTGSATSDSPAAIASPVTLGGQVLSEVIAVAAGDGYTVALKSDGTVVAWGDNYSGAVTGISPTAIPQFAIAIPVNLNGQPLSGVIAIAAGLFHTMALTADGRVTVWGANHADQMSPPTGLTGVTAIAAGGSQCLALINGAPRLPYLDALWSGARLILSWPTNTTQFSLQRTHSLTPPVTWMDVHPPPTAVGSRWVVTNEPSGSRYYRLIAP